MALDEYKAAFAKAQDTAQSPKGLLNLDSFLRTWRTEYTMSKAEWTPVEKTGTADLTYRRILGGQFVHEDA